MNRRRLHTVVSFVGRIRKVSLLVVFAFFLAGVLALSSVVVDAQFSEEDAEIDDLKEERERAVKEAALAVSEIDVFEATVDQLAKALDDLNALVELQEIRLESAEKAYQSSLDSIDVAREARQDVLLEAEVVRAHLTKLAVASFTGESSASSEDITELLLSDDPGESARFLHLLELQTGSLNDGIDRLRALETQAAQLVIDEQEAVDAAERLLTEVETRKRELDEAQERQSRVVTAAELRLEAQIAEAAILEERDFELATEIRDKQTSINQRVTAAARRNGVEIPPPVDLDDIATIDFYKPGELPEPTIDEETGEETILIPLDVTPFYQLEVHKDIERQATALFDAAFAQGIDLAGWGYRPIQLQIDLRRAHCGGSEYDIWHRPVSECSPPTARPGFSRHEQGRAIDFTFNGSSITSHSNAGFRWLAANAPQYGFVNLASEPWHWSIEEGAERFPGEN